MIKKNKHSIWNKEGQAYEPDSSAMKSEFYLKYKNNIIGTLVYDNQWVFKYSENFVNFNIQPITDFPNPQKTYTSNELWPFFRTRIPAINQPFQLKKIQKAKVSKNDSVGLLRLFGSETITNPFKLLPA